MKLSEMKSLIERYKTFPGIDQETYDPDVEISITFMLFGRPYYVGNSLEDVNHTVDGRLILSYDGVAKHLSGEQGHEFEYQPDRLR